MDFSNYGPIPEYALSHLKSEKPQHFETLDNLSQDMSGLAHIAEGLLEDIQEHMMKCGTCLSTSIQAGLLIPIENYWQHHPTQVDGLPSYFRLNYN